MREDGLGIRRKEMECLIDIAPTHLAATAATKASNSSPSIAANPPQFAQD